MVSLPKQGSDNLDTPHTLPEITRQALEGMTEHWSGTGPAGKSGEEIPLPARILAVSIAWEKAINSGTPMAVRDMNMRAGTLYDPRLSELVIQLNG
jgi:HD-GYP domain-containing protein (c-di-GMP phosphodiesterase class II)